MSNQQLLPPQHLSQKNIQAYFSPKNHAFLVAMIFSSIVVAIICFAFLIAGAATTFNIIVIALCLLCASIGAIAISKAEKARPTDAAYDKWLKVKVNHLYHEKLQTLGIEEQQIIGDILSFRSCVLPAPQSVRNNWTEQICLKQGKDGKFRSSTTVYTYFIPTAYFIGIVIFDFNALYPTKHDYHYRNYNQPYAYRSITKAEIVTNHMDILYNDTKYLCKTEKLCITMLEGTITHKIDITAVARATFKHEGKSMTLALTRDLERQVNLLRQLLIMNQK